MSRLRLVAAAVVALGLGLPSVAAAAPAGLPPSTALATVNPATGDVQIDTNIHLSEAASTGDFPLRPGPTEVRMIAEASQPYHTTPLVSLFGKVYDSCTGAFVDEFVFLSNNRPHTNTMFIAPACGRVRVDFLGSGSFRLGLTALRVPGAVTPTVRFAGPPGTSIVGAFRAPPAGTVKVRWAVPGLDTVNNQARLWIYSPTGRWLYQRLGWLAGSDLPNPNDPTYTLPDGGPYVVVVSSPLPFTLDIVDTDPAGVDKPGPGENGQAKPVGALNPFVSENPTPCTADTRIVGGMRDAEPGEIVTFRWSNGFTAETTAGADGVALVPFACNSGHIGDHTVVAQGKTSMKRGELTVTGRRPVLTYIPNPEFAVVECDGVDHPIGRLTGEIQDEPVMYGHPTRGIATVQLIGFVGTVMWGCDRGGGVDGVQTEQAFGDIFRPAYSAPLAFQILAFDPDTPAPNNPPPPPNRQPGGGGGPAQCVPSQGQVTQALLDDGRDETYVGTNTLAFRSYLTPNFYGARGGYNNLGGIEATFTTDRVLTVVVQAVCVWNGRTHVTSNVEIARFTIATDGTRESDANPGTFRVPFAGDYRVTISISSPTSTQWRVHILNGGFPVAGGGGGGGTTVAAGGSSTSPGEQQPPVDGGGDDVTVAGGGGGGDDVTTAGGGDGGDGTTVAGGGDGGDGTTVAGGGDGGDGTTVAGGGDGGDGTTVAGGGDGGDGTTVAGGGGDDGTTVAGGGGDATSGGGDDGTMVAGGGGDATSTGGGDGPTVAGPGAGGGDGTTVAGGGAGGTTAGGGEPGTTVATGGTVPASTTGAGGASTSPPGGDDGDFGPPLRPIPVGAVGVA